MSEINATITAWHTRTGTLGSGEPAFTEVALPHPLPCVVTPARRRGSRAEASEGEAPAWSLVARVAPLTAAGITPAVDDRVTVARTAPAQEAETFDVLAREDDGVAYRLDLARRRDAAVEGA